MVARLFTTVALAASVLALPGSNIQARAKKSATKAGDKPASTKEVVPNWPKPKPKGGSAGDQYHSPAWVPHGGKLHGSQWGPHLPPFMGGSPTPHGFPWGSRTAKNTDYYNYHNIPNTGVTRHYDFTLTQTTIAPDGYQRSAYVVNNQFPGPTIEANWGDWIEVKVHNQLPEGTAMHWHGLLQQQTPWFDGVPSVGQCPIAPGSSFTYRFRADLYGTSWYHSHLSAQYANGLAGPMIIYGPHDNADYDVDIGPVMVTDWYHTDYFSLVQQVMAPASQNLPPPASQNALINGKMNYPCSNTSTNCTPNAGISKFYFETGKSYRLRLINSGAEAIQKFSIDGYQLTIMANDFVPIVPYTTDVVTLGVGQRTDVIVKANGTATDAVWMRSNMGTSAFVGGCTLNDGISPEAVAAIYYQNADDSLVPNTTSSVPTSEIESCQNDDLSKTTPYYSITPPSNPAAKQELDIIFTTNGTNNLFFVNNSTFRADYNDPLLLEAKLGNLDFAPHANGYNFGSNSSIQFVVYNHALTGAHPMHMHGHNMYIIDVGSGTWDGSSPQGANPQRRDVQLLPNAVSATEPSYIVVQIDADNPGVWPFHCHIAWHVSAGLYITMVEQPAKIKKDRQIPSISAQTCRDWSKWSGDHLVDEIDSGL